MIDLALARLSLHTIQMDTPTILLLGAAGLVLLIALWSTAKPRRKLPFTKCPSLLTAGELRFYRVLLRAMPEGLAVFVKVRVMDLLSVLPDAWHQYGAPGSGMHVDFVLADGKTLVPILVIELDDKSHAWPEAQKKDAFKDMAFASAGLPLMRVKVGKYDEGELGGRIREAMGRK